MQDEIQENGLSLTHPSSGECAMIKDCEWMDVQEITNVTPPTNGYMITSLATFITKCHNLDCKARILFYKDEMTHVASTTSMSSSRENSNRFTIQDIQLHRCVPVTEVEGVFTTLDGVGVKLQAMVPCVRYRTYIGVQYLDVVGV